MAVLRLHLLQPLPIVYEELMRRGRPGIYTTVLSEDATTLALKQREVHVPDEVSRIGNVSSRVGTKCSGTSPWVFGYMARCFHAVEANPRWLQDTQLGFGGMHVHLG